MVFVLAIFAFVYLMRDAQVLALEGRAGMPARFVVYSAMQLTGVALMVAVLGTTPDISRAWTDRWFAIACVLIQFAELVAAWLLPQNRRWVGWILPSPVLLVALFALPLNLRTTTLLWLAFVGGASALLARAGKEWEDPAFTADFAMLTGCTALLFVPAGFF
jgi:hypothetical protein